VKAVRGAAWNMVTGVGSRVVGMIGTLLLTRFIAPGEMGEVYAARATLAPLELIDDPPVLRHFSARLRPRAG